MRWRCSTTITTPRAESGKRSPASQCFVIHGIRAGNDNFESVPWPAEGDKKIYLSFDYLRSSQLFCALINKRLMNLRALEASLGEFAALLGKGT
jgi:hypothetical protein